MNKQELIEMLNVLLEQRRICSNDCNTTVIENVSPESFEFVIDSTIDYLKKVKKA